MASKVKVPLINREEPLPDMALDGQPVNPDVSGRYKDVERFLHDLQQWINEWTFYCNDNDEFNYRHKQIYNSLYEMVVWKAPLLVKNNVHWSYMTNCLQTIKYDITLGLRVIKYTVLYLKSSFTDIVAFCRKSDSGHTIDETQQFIEETKKRAKKAKSKKHEDMAQAHIDSIEEDTSGGSSGI